MVLQLDLCPENLSYRAAVSCNHRRARFSFKGCLSLCCLCSSCSGQTSTSMHLFPWSDPRRFTATWRTSSTTAGSWRKGNPTRCGSPPSRSCPCAPASRSCTASATTGSMQMMSSTSSRCVGQLEQGRRKRWGCRSWARLGNLFEKGEDAASR